MHVILAEVGLALVVMTPGGLVKVAPLQGGLAVVVMTPGGLVEVAPVQGGLLIDIMIAPSAYVEDNHTQPSGSPSVSTSNHQPEAPHPAPH